MTQPQALAGFCAPSTNGGFVLLVLAVSDPGPPLVRLDLPDWESFRPASAEHRLVEQGYMPAPGSDYIGQRWRVIADTGAHWMPLVSREEAVGA